MTHISDSFFSISCEVLVRQCTSPCIQMQLAGAFVVVQQSTCSLTVLVVPEMRVIEVG